MDYFKLFGGRKQEDGQTPESVGAETVERLVERVQTASQYEDRRDAIKALKALAKKYRLEVGTIAMPVLMDSLKNERTNPDILCFALDALCSVIGESEEVESPEDETDELGERFAEIFIKNTEQVSILLSLLEDYEFAIRRPAIHLVTGLLRHCSRQLQDILLQDPTAIPRLIDLLQDHREILRNDAVLLLGELTRGNAHIQKLLAYENAFHYLIDVIFHEGDSIVVEDCLFVVLNLLKNNPSNQELFREHSLIQRLSKWLSQTLWPSEDNDLANGESLHLDTPTTHWTNQKVSNVIYMYQVVRALVSPNNPASSTAAAQKIMRECGLLAELCEVLMANGATVEVLTETIVTVAEVIRGCEVNQQYFGSITYPEDESPNPKSAVIVLLISLTNEKQIFELRCAVLYCFQAYVYKNEFGKKEIIKTLLPASAEVSQSLSAGHYLCSALVGSESLQVWLGAVALMHCLLDSTTLKEQLLRVQLATSLGEAPISLLHQVCSILSHGNRRPQIRSGFLMLLSVWLVKCPVAVSHFLHREENITYLTSQVGGVIGGENSENEDLVFQGLCAFLLGVCLLYNDDSVEKSTRLTLSQVIQRRVGRDTVAERLEALSRSEPYVRAAQRPHPYAKNASDLLLDHQFTKVFKSLEGQVVKLLRSTDGSAESSAIQNGTTSPTNQQHQNIIQSYKELIKRQDTQIGDMSHQLKKLQNELEKERNNTKESHLASANSKAMESEMEKLRAELSEKCNLLDQVQTQQTEPVYSETDTKTNVQNTQLQYEVENLTALVQQWQMEANRHYQFAQQWQQFQVAQLPDPTNQVLDTLANQQRESEDQITYGWQMFEQQSHTLAEMMGQKTTLEQNVSDLQSQLDHYKKLLVEEQYKHQQAVKEAQNAAASQIDDKQLEMKEEELSNLRKEQEDLLVLLADQDQKIRDYRRRIKAMGQEVTEEEDSDEDDENNTNLL